MGVVLEGCVWFFLMYNYVVMFMVCEVWVLV